MIGGRIKCDYCGFVGEMEFSPQSKTVLKAPSGWVSIHPTITFHGQLATKNLRAGTQGYEERMKLKEKIKARVHSQHVCPGCLFERDVMALRLPNHVTAEFMGAGHERE